MKISNSPESQHSVTSKQNQSDTSIDNMSSPEFNLFQALMLTVAQEDGGIHKLETDQKNNPKSETKTEDTAVTADELASTFPLINLPMDVVPSVDKTEKVQNNNEINLTEQAKKQQLTAAVATTPQKNPDMTPITHGLRTQEDMLPLTQTPALSEFAAQTAASMNHIPLRRTEKYSDTFVQMGNLVNAQIAGKLDTYGKSDMLGSPAAASSDFATAMKAAQIQEPEIYLDYLPQASGAAHKEVYEAKINLYPPELGHMVAKLKVDHNNAELVIMAQNSQVKEAIESNLNQLRQHFHQADLNLLQVQVDIFQSNKNGKNEQNLQDQPEDLITNSTVKTDEEIVSSETKGNRLNHIIDTYA